MDRKRELELRKVLEDRRREVAGKITQKLCDVRVNGAEKPHHHPYGGEIGGGIDVQLEVQEDIELILIQMKADTLGKIDEALACFRQGHLAD